MTADDAVSLIDAWMRHVLGPGWLRGSEDRLELVEFIRQRFGVEVGKAAGKLRPEPMALGGVVIKDHAVKRYRERTKCHPSRSDTWVRGNIRKQLTLAEEVWLKPRFRVKQICNHGFTRSRYYRSAGGLLFIVEEGKVLRTVHHGESGKWQTHP